MWITVACCDVCASFQLGNREKWAVFVRRRGEPATMMVWDEDAAKNPNAKHICPKESCREAVVAKWLEDNLVKSSAGMRIV